MLLTTHSHVHAFVHFVSVYWVFIYVLQSVIVPHHADGVSSINYRNLPLQWRHKNPPSANYSAVPLQSRAHISERYGVQGNGKSAVNREYGFLPVTRKELSTEIPSRNPRVFRAHGILDDDPHRMLKQLSLGKEKYFDRSPGRKCSLYRYFNLTKDNVEQHLSSTMDEYEANRKAQSASMLYVVDGNAFNGDYTGWKLPISREMASYDFDGLNPNALKTLSEQRTGVEPKFKDEMLSSIYQVISTPEPPMAVNATEAMIDLYDEVGDYSFYETCRGKVIQKDYQQDEDTLPNEDAKQQREMMHRVLSHTTMEPSYLDPDNPAHRTGRGRELQRKSDSGRLQRLRWEMDVDSKDDIMRGNRATGNQISKEFLDSIEWEQPMPTYHDRNFYKRSFYEGGFGGEDRTPDSYFDIQFIGSTDAYPYAVSAGMQYAWPIYWVPMLRKKHPKRYGQPIRSPVFNLGGVEPMQLWFYPEGSASSEEGYCSLKVITPPGWCLPYRIYLFVFSEYNRVVVGPLHRESAEYVTRSLNFCRLVDKSDREVVRMRENDKDYVILGPAGNVYVGVGIVDEPVRKTTRENRFAYDWDEGDYDFNQWLKKQTSDPDDAFQQDNVDKQRTHSIWYESHKYRYVPDRHVSRYWKARYGKSLDWRQPTF